MVYERRSMETKALLSKGKGEQVEGTHTHKMLLTGKHFFFIPKPHL